MTEAEAITKWCPFSRAQLSDTTYANNPPNAVNRSKTAAVVPDSCRCIGSECIAWRWLKQDHNVGGYCGFVGK